MSISEDEARDIAARWGKVATSEPLIDFARTGLVEDRKKLVEAIDYVRLFLKYPEEVDRLREYITHPCPYEVAAREEGWEVQDDAIIHTHDYDKAVTYKKWEDCCESEDIVLREDELVPKKRRLRRS
ncbi:MAG: hypothetical protein JWM91_2216 [Rhodospirillales bacterium]|nr:hypothetical protein [Rhodospirillales bacterium]